MFDLPKFKRSNQIIIFLLILTWVGSLFNIEIALLLGKNFIADLHLPLLIFLATSFALILVVLRNTNQTLEQKNQEITIAKQKFAETARDLESLLESMDALILVINQEEKIKRTNGALETLIGKSKEQLFGQPLATILTDLNPKPAQNHGNYTVSNFPLIKALHGTDPEPEIVKLGCLDQENFFLLSANPVVNKKTGEIVGAISLFRDITEIRMLDKLKDEFIGTVSHELKTPLAVIKGFAQLQKLYIEKRKKILNGMEKLPSRIQEFFDPMVDESTIDKTLAEINVMAEMIDQMVHITRIDSGRLHLNMVYIDLLPLIQDIITGLDLAIASNRIELITDGASYYPAYIDPSAFRQILHNLISNAIKYSPPDITNYCSRNQCRR